MCIRDSAGIETTIFERESCLGGVPRHVIPSFRIANEAIEKDIALMEKYGVEVKCGAPAPSVDELKKMGYTHIRGFLWYVFANELEEVTLPA